MTADLANTLVVAAAVAALVCIALAALIGAFALVRVSRDVRRVARSLNDVTAALNAELPQTLSELRQTSANLNRVSQEVAPRLARVDALFDEADATVASLRATVEAAEDIVRGPAAAMDRAKRAAGAVGGGIVRGADRLVRSVQERTNRRE